MYFIRLVKQEFILVSNNIYFKILFVDFPNYINYIQMYTILYYHPNNCTKVLIKKDIKSKIVNNSVLLKSYIYITTAGFHLLNFCRT
jgi:hypothetical protein